MENTIDKKIYDLQSFKEAKESLEDFRKMMDLIKRYPVKPIQSSLPYQPYKINQNIYRYNQ